ncbi:MAG: restriction endonuclease subunit S [Candidatus Binatia bacterium]
MSDWVEKDLGTILRLNYGWSLPEKKRVVGEVPVYGSNGVVGSHNKALVASPGLIVGRKGSAGNVHYSQTPFCPIDTTFYITPNDATVDIEFLYYLLTHLDLKRILGDVGVPGLNREIAYKEKTRLPEDRDEQRKIAVVLGLVRRAVEQQERLIAVTTELKKTLLHKLFTGGLRGEPQKQTEIGPMPESWEQRPLEEAGDVIYGIQAAVASNLKPIGMKILTNKNITLDGKIVLDSINYFVLKTKRHQQTVLKKGDLLFNWRSGSKEHVGKTAYFDLDGEFTHSSFILRIRPTNEVTGKYLFYYLNFLRGSGYFVKSQTFSVNAKFNKSAINRLPTYLPEDHERSEIVTTLDAVTRKIEVVETRKRLLEDLFRTLLHQLMTAQIRVHDLDLPELEATGTE